MRYVMCILLDKWLFCEFVKVLFGQQDLYVTVYVQTFCNKNRNKCFCCYSRFLFLVTAQCKVG